MTKQKKKIDPEPEINLDPEPEINYITCPECGNKQPDMGKHVKCEECGYGPMPTEGDNE